MYIYLNLKFFKTLKGKEILLHYPSANLHASVSDARSVSLSFTAHNMYQISCDISVVYIIEMLTRKILKLLTHQTHKKKITLSTS